MIYPVVHLNGTSGLALKYELICARNAISQALCKLQNCTPNGRDYPHGGFDQAVQDHCNRLQRLTDVSAELEGIVMSVSDQCEE